MLDRRRALRVSPKKPIKAKVKTSLTARVVDISSLGVQVELAYSLPLRTRCDVRLQNGGADLSLTGTVRRCTVLGWTEHEGKKVLMYRAGLEFEGTTRELVQALEAKFPELFEGARPTTYDVPAQGEASPKDIEVIIQVQDGGKKGNPPDQKG